MQHLAEPLTQRQFLHEHGPTLDTEAQNRFFSRLQHFEFSTCGLPASELKQPPVHDPPHELASPRGNDGAPQAQPLPPPPSQMLPRRHLNPSAFFPLLLGRGSARSTAASLATLPASLPPLRHFIERLLGGAATLSSVDAPAAPRDGDNSLTLHFLRQSCGLAEPQAAAVAARVHLRSTKNAHAVLAVLRSFGFKPASIVRLVTTRPSVLSSTNIGAKLDFYRSELGLSDTEICRLVLSSPHRALEASLEGRLRPNHRLLRDLLGTDKNVLAAVIQSMRLITDNLQHVFLPKLKTLRDHGVTEEVLVKLVTTHPKALTHESSRFDEGLAAMKDLGVSPSSGIFPYAFGLFSRMYQSKWDRRMKNFLSLGWTEEQVRKAFARHPYCMSASEDKRVLPRCTVLNLLASTGVIKQVIKVSHLMMTEKRFAEKYITTYQEVIPQVLEAYGARTATVVNFEAAIHTRSKYNSDDYIDSPAYLKDIITFQLEGLTSEPSRL
ncbi:hypothetical protein EJB05_49619, partial [Eragrostis curvula]